MSLLKATIGSYPFTNQTQCTQEAYSLQLTASGGRWPICALAVSQVSLSSIEYNQYTLAAHAKSPADNTTQLQHPGIRQQFKF